MQAVKRKRRFALLLAFCLALTACGGRQDQTGEDATPGYTAQYMDCDLPFMSISAVCTDGGILYAAGEVPEETGDEELSYASSGTSTADGETTSTFSTGGRPAIFQVDLATGAVTELSGYVPASEEGQVSISGLDVSEGGLWVLEETAAAIPADLDMESGELITLLTQGPASSIWRKLDADTGGWEMERIDITDLARKLGAEAVLGTAMDAANRLYASTGSTVAVLDSGGDTIFTVKGQNLAGRLVRLADGTTGVLTWDQTLRTIDPEVKDWGASYSLSGNLGGLYPGSGEYLACFDSGDSLYAQTAAGPQRLLSWSGADVDPSQVRAFSFLPDGRGAALVEDISGWPAKYSVALLSPAEGDGGKTVLTLATLGLDSDTRTKILNFNRTNGQYRVEVRDYSEFNTGDDPSAGRTKLNTEIVAGNVPDLLDASMDIRQYVARGLLEDLWPYIEADPDIGREGVMERVFQAAETDGKLYQVFPRFTIRTAAGAPEIVGEKMGWTLDQLRSALAKMPEGSSIMDKEETRDSILETLLEQNLDRFVDWAAGTASFDSTDFRSILEFCAGFPAGTAAPEGAVAAASAVIVGAESRVMAGEQMLYPVDLGDVTSLQLYRNIFGGSVTFVGYPTRGGSGSSFAVEGALAMSAACANKEGAWAFLRTLLLPGENEPFFGAFPASRPAFEQAIAESMEANYVEDENGEILLGADGKPVLETTGIWVIDGRMIIVEPASQEDVDQLMALYEATDTLSGRDEQIWAIVQEGAAAYFNGDQTAEEAAEAVQSRVELYLGERK